MYCAHGKKKNRSFAAVKVNDVAWLALLSATVCVCVPVVYRCISRDTRLMASSELL
jgi:hypothetical protein